MPTNPHDKIWQETFTVRAYETDHHRQATIQTLSNYFQEAASNHANKLQVSVTQWDNQHLTWVLGRLHIQVFHFPEWQEVVTLTTNPAGGNRLYAFRDFVITDPIGNPVAIGTSAWIVLDTKRRRPVRVPDYILDMKPEGKERILHDDFKSRLSLPETPQHQKTFHVRMSDLDMNQHANLVNYIEWAIEAIPGAHHETYRLTDLLVEFQKESVYGDCVISESEQESEPNTATQIFRHHLYLQHTKQTLAKVQTVWSRK